MLKKQRLSRVTQSAMKAWVVTAKFRNKQTREDTLSACLEMILEQDVTTFKRLFEEWWPSLRREV